MGTPLSSHPTDRTLHAYGLGKLDDATAEAVDAHLETCEACRRRTAEMAPDSFLGRLRDGRPTGGLERPDSARPPAGSAAPAPVDTLPPGLAGHKDYEVVRELGRGGMGVVYLVRNRLMGRDEVLKVMAGHLVERPEVRERFLREIRAVASLRHPNIVAAHHAFHVGETIAFTMEHVDGYDLSGMVKSRGPLPVAHACLFARQAAQGLQHAHEEGMVHRDIKPGNLMVARRGERAVVKILDFGLAKAVREGQFDGALTHAGQMLGTPDFIAPEQIADAQNADIRADIYSLGCTLYYLLSGSPPFRAASLYDLLQAHHSMDARLLNFVRPEVPSELAALVAKMMAKDPGRRFRTPGEVSEALAPFSRKGGSAIGPVKPDVSRAAPTEDRRRPTAGEPSPTAPARPPAAGTKAPAEALRPETRWASLIGPGSPGPASEGPAPPPTPPGPTRNPPWKSRPAIAAASLFGAVALGIVISISGNKGGPVAGASDPGVGNAKAAEVPMPRDELKWDRPILAQLDKRLTLSFPQPTPLEDFLKYIKSNTQDERSGLPAGIPIYVDPIGLQEAEKTLQSSVTIDLEGIPLKESLRLVLQQLGLHYRVTRGLLLISDPERIEERCKLLATAPSAPDDHSPETKAILAGLDERLTLSFPQETPLEDFLKYIKSNTQDERSGLPAGIPIYVDPIGLQEAEKTLQSPVTIDLEGVPLSATLPLVLGQSGLHYGVKNGLLIISSRERVERELGAIGAGGSPGPSRDPVDEAPETTARPRPDREPDPG